MGHIPFEPCELCVDLAHCTHTDPAPADSMLCRGCGKPCKASESSRCPECAPSDDLERRLKLSSCAVCRDVLPEFSRMASWEPWWRRMVTSDERAHECDRLLARLREAEKDVQRSDADNAALAKRMKATHERIGRLEGALRVAIGAIESLPDDALGIDHGPAGESWPISAEVLTKLRAALEETK